MEYKPPPKFILRLLKWFCNPDYYPDIEGDLLELHERRWSRSGPKKAFWMLVKDVLLLFRPGILKIFSSRQKLNQMGILKQNIIITFRNYRRYKTSFLINLLGLTAGLMSGLMIYLWVLDEYKVDKFHEHDNRLYQVMGNHTQSDGITTWNGTSALMAEGLEENVPEIEMAIGATDTDWNIGFDLESGETKVKSIGRFVGKDFFRMFTFRIIKGNPFTPLSEKNSMVITEELAIKIFGSTDNVIGNSIRWTSLSTNGLVTITAICETPPKYSTDQFEFVLPFSQYTDDFAADWNNFNSTTQVLLSEDADLEQVNSKISDFLDDKLGNSNVQTFLAKYSDSYLWNNYENGVVVGGRIENVKLFSWLAIFIVLIACVNFMNLSTARASRRIKEIGVKKAIGVGRSALIGQYLSESLIMVQLSFFMAVILVVWLLPYFNYITGKSIELVVDMKLVGTYLIITTVTGLVAGIYPALYMSKFKAKEILGGRIKSSKGELWMRRGLVIFQFGISMLLIASVAIIYSQVQFIHQKDLGFNKDNILIFEREGKVVESLDVFLDGIKNVPGVVNASAINNEILHAPGVQQFYWDGQIEERTDFSRFIVYYDFIETLGVELIRGRTFSRSFKKNSQEIILNERAADIMGFKDPIGKKAVFSGRELEIVGVVRDFHFKSLHEKVGPMFFHLDPSFLLNVVVRIEEGSEQEALSALDEYYHEFNPGYAFNYRFLDHDFNQVYAMENRTAEISKYFASIAIIISCLGLFGLAAFTAEKRMKEIGIRKILGSGVCEIVGMLSNEFTRIVLLAVVIALPISYWLTSLWLAEFEYRIELKWWYFAGSGLLAILIAWGTVAFQTIRAAMLNPSQCLRDE